MAGSLAVKALIPLLKPDQGGKTVCLFGDSGDGKTALVGEIAEHVYTYAKAPDGKPMRTRVYAADEGGWDVITPQISLGIVEVVDCRRLREPWAWLNAVAQGQVLDSAGRWVPGVRPDVGVYAFDSGSAMASSLRIALSAGDNNLMLKPAQAGDKDAHGRTYGLTQDRMGEIIKLSFRLPGLKIWTFLARRGDDADTNAPILGPQIVGKALTSEVPSWFNYTFRIMGIPADELTKQPEKHRLFLGDFVDMASRGAKGLGNNRKPLDGSELPPFIEPASLVMALALIDQASRTATDVIRARLRAAGILPA